MIDALLQLNWVDIIVVILIIRVAYISVKSGFPVEIFKLLDTWRDLSKSGASFNNDVVGMTAAAAGARLPLNEFADVIKSNSGNFNGLGGSAAKGAENFAKLSKEMADSGVTDDLRQLGYTSKDINDVLAIQLSSQQTINMNDEAARKRAIKSATELATEMDMMSKLTGKSRAEQEENMKKAQADMQVEAKLRILTAGKSEEEAARIRSEYTKNYNEAQLRGQGQMFKEVFATGTIQSEEAANQVAISGREAQMTMAQARAVQMGDVKAAGEYSKQALIENQINQRDVNKLQLATMGDATAAGKTMMQSMTDSAGMKKSIDAIEKEAKFAAIKDDKERTAAATEEALKRAKAEQTDKKPGSESTEALVKLGARADDVNSAFMNKVVDPLNKDVGPALKKFNDGLLSSQTVDKKGNVTTKVKDVEGELGEGYERGKSGAKGPNAGTGIVGAAKDQKAGNVMESAAGTVGETAGFASSLIVPALDKVADTMNGIPKKAEGGTVDKPELAIIGEAGKEHVVPDAKMQTLMQNMKVDGLTAAATAMADSQKKDSGGGVNVSEISNLVKTTISSASGPTAGTSAPAAPMTKSEKFQTSDWADATQEEIAKGLEGSKKQLARWTTDAQETEQKIADIKSLGSKRQLTESEQYDLAELEKEKAKNQRAIDYHQTTINVLSNLDEYKARLETESKQKTVTATETAAKVAEDLGLKQVETIQNTAAAHEEANNALTDGQRKLVDDYKGYSESNRQFMVEVQKKGIAEDTETAAMIGERITKMKADIGDRQATEEEAAAIKNEELNKAMFENQVTKRKEMLDVMENLGDYSAKRELELKQQTAVATEKAAEATKTTEAVKAEAVKSSAASQEESVKKATEVAKETLKTQEGVTKDQIKKVAEGVAAKDTKKTETSTGIPDFSAMFGGGAPGGLPPFLEKINAQIKDAKPAAIKDKEEANKATPKSTANAVKEEKKEEPKKPARKHKFSHFPL